MTEEFEVSPSVGILFLLFCAIATILGLVKYTNSQNYPTRLSPYVHLPPQKIPLSSGAILPLQVVYLPSEKSGPSNQRYMGIPHSSRKPIYQNSLTGNVGKPKLEVQPEQASFSPAGLRSPTNYMTPVSTDLVHCGTSCPSPTILNKSKNRLRKSQSSQTVADQLEDVSKKDSIVSTSTTQETESSCIEHIKGRMPPEEDKNGNDPADIKGRHQFCQESWDDSSEHAQAQEDNKVQMSDRRESRRLQEYPEWDGNTTIRPALPTTITPTGVHQDSFAQLTTCSPAYLKAITYHTSSDSKNSRLSVSTSEISLSLAKDDGNCGKNKGFYLIPKPEKLSEKRLSQIQVTICHEKRAKNSRRRVRGQAFVTKS